MQPCVSLIIFRPKYSFRYHEFPSRTIDPNEGWYSSAHVSIWLSSNLERNAIFSDIVMLHERIPSIVFSSSSQRLQLKVKVLPTTSGP